MAKDALGHGSDSRGGGAAPQNQGIWPKPNPLANQKMTAAEQRKSGAADAAFQPAHSTGIARATAPITEHQQVPGGNKTWASNYAYQGRDKASGLHKFSEDGRTDLFAKRSTAPSGWHLSRGASKFEFVRSGK